jgi:hypothetical protein
MIYLQETFEVYNTRKEFYDKVTRVFAKNKDLELSIDLHNIVADKINKFELILSSEFIDGHCVMHGIVYKGKNINNTDISFHGLLMNLNKDINLEIDSQLYAIIII